MATVFKKCSGLLSTYFIPCYQKKYLLCQIKLNLHSVRVALKTDCYRNQKSWAGKQQNLIEMMKPDNKTTHFTYLLPPLTKGNFDGILALNPNSNTSVFNCQEPRI